MTSDKQVFNAKIRLDGNDLRGMFSYATRLFEHNVDTINALNVFPVPDGDTGINMFLTLESIVKEAADAEGSSAGEAAAAMARGALMGARGNSGVILSQFFKGIALELDGKFDFGAAELVSALQSAKRQAYEAVGEPVEGTMLTVISNVAKAVQAKFDTGTSILDLFDTACVIAKESVALTPTMLPVLRDAGVVDAGGHGLFVILEGIRLYMKGEELDTKPIPPPAPVGVTGGTGIVSNRFLGDAKEKSYGYCTQFLIHGQNLDLNEVRNKMVSLANSTVVIGDNSVVKVHVHSDDPEAVTRYANSIGTVSQLQMDNMDEQHREYSITHKSDTNEDSTPVVPPISIVAMAFGQGLEDVFANLGAERTISPRDVMNPSVQEILDVVESISSDTVIFLPNNPNILPAARQVAELSDKKFIVISSTTMPQGVTALLAFNSEKDLGENLADMESALSTVRTGEICQAVRSVVLNGVSVKKGQIIGLLDRKLVVSGDDPLEVTVSLVLSAEISDGDLVTLYWGKQVSQIDADAVKQRMEAIIPGIEVEIVPGGQTHYHYILSIE